jgi:hypothetical protein
MAGCLTNRRFPVGLIPSPRGTLGQRKDAITMRAQLRTKCSVRNVRPVPPVTERLVHHDSFHFPITAATCSPRRLTKSLSCSAAQEPIDEKSLGPYVKLTPKLFEGILRVQPAADWTDRRIGDRPRHPSRSVRRREQPITKWVTARFPNEITGSLSNLELRRLPRKPAESLRNRKKTSSISH